MQNSHHGTDFCPSDFVWLVFGTTLAKRIVKVNAVKRPGGKNKESVSGVNVCKLSIKVNGS